MTGQIRRIASAWLLLSVFVSMMTLSGLHRHQSATNAVADCPDCSHGALHHSGHLTASGDGIHDCVLCQFLSLVYTPAATLLVGVLVSSIRVVRPLGNGVVRSGIDHHKSPRAPPFIL